MPLIPGPQGLVGPRGPVGIQGAQGIQGVQGAAGTQTYFSAVTGIVDFTTLASGTPFNPPLTKSGYIFLCNWWMTYVKTAAGSATGNFQYSIGNNSTSQNNVAQPGLLGASSINGLVGITPISAAIGNGSGTSALLDSVTPITVKITSVPTGLSSFTGMVVVSGVWVPV